MSFIPKGVQFLYNADLDTGPALWINGKPTGFTDSYVGSLSVAFKYQEPHLNDSERYPIFVSNGRDFQLELPATQDVALGVERAFLMLEIGTPIGSDWAITIDCPGMSDGECHHLQISWDSNHPRNEKVVSAAWDGAPATVLENDDGRDNPELVRMGTITNFNLGMYQAYQTQHTLSMAEFYLQNAVYIDFNDQANINKFWSAETGFADLGSDGSLPTGSVPLFYQSVRDGDLASAFQTNRGSSDDFTNGAGFGSDPLILVDTFCPGGGTDPETAPQPQLKYGIDPVTPQKALANERLVRAKWAAIDARNAMEERDRQLEIEKRQQEKKRRKEQAELQRLRQVQIRQWTQRLAWLNQQTVLDEEALRLAIAEAQANIIALSMETKR